MFKFASVMLAALLVIASGASQTSFSIHGDVQQPTGKEDATPVQACGLTEKQKEHSKLYKKFRSEKKLRDLVTTTQGDVGIVRGIPDKTFSPNSPPFNLNNFLSALACKADAVVIGVVQDKSSLLTEDEDFIFTDYKMTVEEILKNNLTAPIKSASEITITRPGGTIQLDGRNVSALDQSLEPLEIGQRYLIFLEFIPTTGSYKAFNSQGTFLLDGQRIIKLTKESLPSALESGSDRTAFTTMIRKAIESPCHQ